MKQHKTLWTRRIELCSPCLSAALTCTHKSNNCWRYLHSRCGKLCAENVGNRSRLPSLAFVFCFNFAFCLSSFDIRSSRKRWEVGELENRFGTKVYRIRKQQESSQIFKSSIWIATRDNKSVHRSRPAKLFMLIRRKRATDEDYIKSSQLSFILLRERMKGCFQLTQKMRRKRQIAVTGFLFHLTTFIYMKMLSPSLISLADNLFFAPITSFMVLFSSFICSFSLEL